MLQGADLKDMKKFPQDPGMPLQTMAIANAAALGAPGATPAAPGSAGDATSVAAVTTALPDEEDDAQERRELGLPEPASKTKAKAKARVKRSRAEIVEEEVAKMKSEMRLLIEALAKFPDQPKMQEIGRVERMLSKKRSEFKDACDFEANGEINQLHGQLEVLRAAMKPAISYLTGTLQTKKKIGKDFMDKMAALKEQYPVIYHRFSSETLKAHVELEVTRRTEDKDWPFLAKVLSKEELESSQMEALPILEKIVASHLKALEIEDDKSKTPAVGDELCELLQQLALNTEEETKAATTFLASVVGRRSLPDTPLEQALSLVASGEKDPLYRVLHDSMIGTELISLADKAHKDLVAMADAQATMQECLEILEALKSNADFDGYLSGAEGHDQQFKSIMEKFTVKCDAFSVACMDAHLRDGLGKKGCDLIQTLCTKLVTKLAERLNKELGAFYNLISSEDTISSANGEWQLGISIESIYSYLKAVSMEGHLFSFLQRLKGLSLLHPKDVMLIFDFGAVLLHLVPWRRFKLGLAFSPQGPLAIFQSRAFQYFHLIKFQSTTT